MKKIFTIIFGVLIFFITGILVVNATVTSETFKNVAPILGVTKGIKVYIPPKNRLSVTMQHAFMDWQKHTNNNFTFEYVGTQSTANITVVFIDSGMVDICKSSGALGCTTYAIANTLYLNRRIQKAKVYISMNDMYGKPMTNNQVYTIMLHEIGHALGLQHSQNPNSLMYEITNSQMAEGQEIRQTDLDALYKLYGLTPKH